MSAKVAIVFGGSHGIGGAIASRLALDRFDVAPGWQELQFVVSVTTFAVGLER
jgi:NAD(P)-dependent dehydrogenase (short-subunit alcohol dehydrogenase family)